MSTTSTYRECIACHEQDNIQHYCDMNSLEYVKCQSCGLIYVNQFANDEQMREAYTGGSFKSLRRKLMGPFRKLKHFKDAEHFAARGREIYQAAKQAIKLNHHKRLLDIGCNKGFILAAAADDGNEVYGVELVTELVMPFKNTYPQFKDNIFSDKFEDVAKRFSDGFFDIITCIDVVEHFEDPIHDMKHVYRMLNDDGVFVIQTPDAGCKEALQLGCDWMALKPLEHLHLFDQQNFTKLAKQAGFSEVVYTAEPFEYADGNFAAILKK